MNAHYGRSDAGRVEPVRFWQLPLAPVIFREASAARLQGQTCRLEAFKEHPSGRIDDGSVCERRFRLRKDALSGLGLVHQKLLDVLGAFCAGDVRLDNVM